MKDSDRIYIAPPRAHEVDFSGKMLGVVIVGLFAALAFGAIIWAIRSAHG